MMKGKESHPDPPDNRWRGLRDLAYMAVLGTAITAGAMALSPPYPLELASLVFVVALIVGLVRPTLWYDPTRTKKTDPWLAVALLSALTVATIGNDEAKVNIAAAVGAMLLGAALSVGVHLMRQAPRRRW